MKINGNSVLKFQRTIDQCEHRHCESPLPKRPFIWHGLFGVVPMYFYKKVCAEQEGLAQLKEWRHSA